MLKESYLINYSILSNICQMSGHYVVSKIGLLYMSLTTGEHGGHVE
jgi:hypothetical protein